jgi:hypothetical protein
MEWRTSIIDLKALNFDSRLGARKELVATVSWPKSPPRGVKPMRTRDTRAQLKMPPSREVGYISLQNPQVTVLLVRW